MPWERRHSSVGCGTHPKRLILAGAGFELLETELHLVDQQVATFGALTVEEVIATDVI